MGQQQRPQQISPSQPLNSSYDSSNDHKIPRRTFGLFCLCDFLLVFLLWTIMLSIKKKNQTFLQMFSYEINHYKISTSMADVVLLSITRDSVLVVVYLMMSGNHWMVAALCAVCSSAFLLTKVFLYPMSDSGQPVTYFTILGSFAMTWIATYMVDFKKLRNYANQSANHTNFNLPNGQVAPDVNDALARVGLTSSSHNRPMGHEDANSIYVTVNGSEIGEENRIVLPILEEDEDLSTIEKMAEIESREAFEIGVRLHDLPGEDWKLEECGSLGTCVCMKQVAELGRVYKLEMVINLSPQQLHSELCNYEQVPLWDKTVNSTTLLHNINDVTKVLRIVSNEMESKRNIAQREFIVAMRTTTIGNTLYSFGSSIDYPTDNNDSANQISSSSEDLSKPREKLTRGECKIMGYIIKKLDNDPEKCEFVRFLSTDIKSWIAQFRVDKAITHMLLNFADCLLKRSNEIASEKLRNSSEDNYATSSSRGKSRKSSDNLQSSTKMKSDDEGSDAARKLISEA